MYRIRQLGLSLAIAAAAIGVATACTEKLDGGAACPSLCPSQDIPIRDTVLSVVSVGPSGDTTFVDSVAVTVAGIPALGAESYLLLASRGDTLDTRVVTRYDSLPQRFIKYPSTSDTTTAPIVQLTAASLKLRLDTTGTRVTQPVTINVFDVDSAGTDSVGGLFRPDRLIGSATFAVADLVDSIAVPLSTDSILAKITSAGRVRFGLQLTSAASAQLRFFATTSTSSTVGPALSITVPDTGVKSPFLFGVRSLDPRGDAQRARELSDYTFVVKGPPQPTTMMLAVGGLPSHRTYIRFSLPATLVDSATVVRATLELTQIPSPSAGPNDSISIFPMIAVAGRSITDPIRAASFAQRTVFFSTSGDSVTVPTLRVVPSGSGVRQIELGDLVRRWRTHSALEPRAIILESAYEGASGAEALFYSNSAPQALRPRLHIRYISRVQFGLP